MPTAAEYLTINHGLNQRSCSTLGPVTTWMGDFLLTGKPSRHLTSQSPRSTQPSIPLG